MAELDAEVHNGAEGLGLAFEVATDDDGDGKHLQLVRLARSTSRQPIVADGNGLDVDVVRMPRGNLTFSDPAPTSVATLVLAANDARKSAIIQNVGTVDVYLGNSGVTTSTGILLLAGGATLTDEFSDDAWYGITVSGTADLRVVEAA